MVEGAQVVLAIYTFARARGRFPLVNLRYKSTGGSQTDMFRGVNFGVQTAFWLFGTQI